MVAIEIAIDGVSVHLLTGAFAQRVLLDFPLVHQWAFIWFPSCLVGAC